MAILARLAFHTPVTLSEVSYEGIESITPDDLAFAKELGLSLKLLGVAERRGEAISVRVFPCFLYSGHPLAPIEGAFNAVMIQARGDQRGDPVGTRRGRPADGERGARRRRLDPRRRRARCTRRGPSCRSSPTSRRASTCTSRSPTSPACWRGSRPSSATTTSRSRASSSAGSATDARLVMVLHECLESRFARAVEALNELGELRGAGALDPRDRGGAPRCPNAG